MEAESTARPPSILDALIPVVALIALIALSVYLFGLDATSGPLQIAIFTAMVIAGLIAHKNGLNYVCWETPSSAVFPQRWGRSSFFSPWEP